MPPSPTSEKNTRKTPLTIAMTACMLLIASLLVSACDDAKKPGKNTNDHGHTHD
jgi:hypothetical protein